MFSRRRETPPPAPTETKEFTLDEGGFSTLEWRTFIERYPIFGFFASTRSSSAGTFTLKECEGSWLIHALQDLGPEQAELEKQDEKNDEWAKNVYLIGKRVQDNEKIYRLGDHSSRRLTLQQAIADPDLVGDPYRVTYVVVVETRRDDTSGAYSIKITPYRNTGQLQRWRQDAVEAASKRFS